MDYSHTPATSVITPQVSKIAVLVLRVLTTILLVLSLAILVSNVLSFDTDHKVHFYNHIPYRYMAAAIILGIAYFVPQTAVAVVSLKRESPRKNILLQFYGDKVLSIVLATGAVAGFVMTAELQKQLGSQVVDYYHKYFSRSHAADGFLLLSFICAFVLSVISSYALPKKIYT